MFGETIVADENAITERELVVEVRPSILWKDRTDECRRRDDNQQEL